MPAVASVATKAARARAAQLAMAMQPLTGTTLPLAGTATDLSQQLVSLSATMAPLQRADMPQVDTFVSKVSASG